MGWERARSVVHEEVRVYDARDAEIVHLTDHVLLRELHYAGYEESRDRTQRCCQGLRSGGEGLDCPRVLRVVR